MDLFNVVSKKITTSFVGALAEFEKAYSEEINANPEKWEEVRRNILKNGNGQIRNLEKELDNFEIKQKRYTYKFTFRRTDES